MARTQSHGLSLTALELGELSSSLRDQQEETGLISQFLKLFPTIW